MKIIEAFKRTLNKMREREVKVDTKKMEDVVDKLEPLELFDSGDPEDPNLWETKCPKREDEAHCNCWYDEKACCACGDNPPHVCEPGCSCADALEGEIWENAP